MEKLCSLFLHYLRYTKKMSPHTLRSYQSDLKQFFSDDPEDPKGSKDSKRKMAPKKLELHMKNRIDATMKKWHHLSPASQNRKLATVKSFIRWLLENRYIKQDFRFLFKSPKLFHKIPLFLSVDEIFAIIREMEMAHKNKEKDIERDQALFFLLYGGGLRVSEACHIKKKNIYKSESVLKIKGKGGKERIVAVPEQVMFYLNRMNCSFMYLFGEKPLSERSAYKIIRKWGNRSGILKPIHPHVLRHSFATHLLLGGSDIRVLQELMGHTTLSATQRYTHLDIHQLSRTLEQYHPLNKD